MARFWRQTVEVIDGNSSFVWTCSTLICILNDARNNRQQRVLNCFISSNDKYLRPRIFSDWRRRRPVNQSRRALCSFFNRAHSRSKRLFTQIKPFFKRRERLPSLNNLSNPYNPNRYLKLVCSRTETIQFESIFISSSISLQHIWISLQQLDI